MMAKADILMDHAHRMQRVQSPIIPVVHALIRKHPGTISLGQGVVHYGPPPKAVDRIRTFLAEPHNHKYQDVAGIPELLDLITAKLAAENRIELGDEKCVVVSAGGNMAFMNAVFAVTDPGDQVIILKPFYFNHEMAVRMADCEPVAVSTDPHYQIDLAAIEAAITPRTRAVVTVSPNNPSGAVYNPAALQQVNDLCRRRSIYHISDEAYEYFVYDGAIHFSAGSMVGSGGHTISLFSLSKAYGFASWRIGYMVIPNRLLVSVKKAQDTILICPPVICQHAAAGALEIGAGYCKTHLEKFAEVRRLVLAELVSLSNFCTVPRADGAFYFLLRLETDMDDMQLVEALVTDFGVAVIPGSTFGMHEGCYLRISYGALQKQTAAEGMGRLVRGLQALIGGR